MKLALVNHGPIHLPRDGRPLIGNSIGIWCFEVATRLAADWDVTVYNTKGGWLRRRDVEFGGARFVDLPAEADAKLARVARRVAPRRAVARGLDLPRYARQVARDVASRGIDTIHVSNFSAFVPVLRRACPDAKIDLHMQCDWLVDLDERFVAPHVEAADLLTGCSRYVVDGIARRFPAVADRCHAVHNGVSLERFPPPAPATVAARTGDSILFVGRLSPEKGVHVLLDAFARVVDAVPDATLTLVGDDARVPFDYVVRDTSDPLVRDLARFWDDPSTSYAQACLAKLPAAVRERVTLRPALPQAELAAAYQQADVFCFPSVWNEPFGMIGVEAMASGLPVVSTRGGGIPEFVDDGTTGRLVERGADDELGAALIELLRDPDARARMGAAGRAVVEARFSWDHVADRVREVLTAAGNGVRPTDATRATEAVHG